MQHKTFVHLHKSSIISVISLTISVLKSVSIDIDCFYIFTPIRVMAPTLGKVGDGTNEMPEGNSPVVKRSLSPRTAFFNKCIKGSDARTALAKRHLQLQKELNLELETKRTSYSKLSLEEIELIVEGWKVERSANSTHSRDEIEHIKGGLQANPSELCENVNTVCLDNTVPLKSCPEVQSSSKVIKFNMAHNLPPGHQFKISECLDGYVVKSASVPVSTQEPRTDRSIRSDRTSNLLSSGTACRELVFSEASKENNRKSPFESGLYGTECGTENDFMITTTSVDNTGDDSYTIPCKKLKQSHSTDISPSKQPPPIENEVLSPLSSSHDSPQPKFSHGGDDSTLDHSFGGSSTFNKIGGYPHDHEVVPVEESEGSRLVVDAKVITHCTSDMKNEVSSEIENHHNIVARDKLRSLPSTPMISSVSVDVPSPLVTCDNDTAPVRKMIEVQLTGCASFDSKLYVFSNHVEQRRVFAMLRKRGLEADEGYTMPDWSRDIPSIGYTQLEIILVERFSLVKDLLITCHKDTSVDNLPVVVLWGKGGFACAGVYSSYFEAAACVLQVQNAVYWCVKDIDSGWAVMDAVYQGIKNWYRCWKLLYRHAPTSLTNLDTHYAPSVLRNYLHSRLHGCGGNTPFTWNYHGSLFAELNTLRRNITVVPQAREEDGSRSPIIQVVSGSSVIQVPSMFQGVSPDRVFCRLRQSLGRTQTIGGCHCRLAMFEQLCQLCRTGIRLQDCIKFQFCDDCAQNGDNARRRNCVKEPSCKGWVHAGCHKSSQNMMSDVVTGTVVTPLKLNHAEEEK